MDPGYYVAAGSLKARAFQLEVVANNLANAATVGYKPDQAFFAVFNKAAGMKPEEDRLPRRLMTEPVADGPSEGMLSKLEITLPMYYEARGWVNAFPTDETLKKLGLDECVGK